MGATIFYESATELATLTNTFAVAGTPTDPTTVSLTVTTPTGASTTYTHAAGEITRTGAGGYTKDIASSEAGAWAYVWTGTGAASDTVAGTWTVFSAALAHLYCTAAELKNRVGVEDTEDDFEIQQAVETAAREIDDWCKRHFFRQAGTRVYAADSPYRCTVDDLVSVTSVRTDEAGDGAFETTWAGSDYQLRPVNATAGAVPRPYRQVWAVGGRTWPHHRAVLARAERVEVTGVFGWPAVPTNVKAAARILAAEQLKLKDAPFGVAGFGEFGAVRVRDNPIAVRLLRSYRRRPVLVA
ncbi:hypothetical protein GCM10010124_26160 [Pilimelia terevasa]|uniref:Uncharacterized protein n=1 Tax=Pilimelia terevasa TaxID=53372 RepID=A0A8J3BMK5_9ACTN|nr:hypothetical protein [Pilimelia terevasa]GGK32138.1 hypothetical protein GCM10010124_26160 [Pilimelia terevasa]